MPIKIYSADAPYDELAWLCDDDWELPSQLVALVAWLHERAPRIPPGRYVADVGFAPRPGAAGGGTALKPETLKLLGDLGMSLRLSEYPEAFEGPPMMVSHDGDTAYVRFLDSGDSAVSRTVRVRDLISYEGPELRLDIGEGDALIGIEIVEGVER
jgi:hypothetical protein